jgi:hypothetical protein
MYKGDELKINKIIVKSSFKQFTKLFFKKAQEEMNKIELEKKKRNQEIIEKKEYQKLLKKYKD